MTNRSRFAGRKCGDIFLMHALSEHSVDPWEGYRNSNWNFCRNNHWSEWLKWQLYDLFKTENFVSVFVSKSIGKYSWHSSFQKFCLWVVAQFFKHAWISSVWPAIYCFRCELFEIKSKRCGSSRQRLNGLWQQWVLVSARLRKRWHIWRSMRLIRTNSSGRILGEYRRKTGIAPTGMHTWGYFTVNMIPHYYFESPVTRLSTCFIGKFGLR